MNRSNISNRVEEAANSVEAGQRLYAAGLERQKKLELLRAQERDKAKQEEEQNRRERAFRAKPPPGQSSSPRERGVSSGSIGERMEAWQVRFTRSNLPGCVNPCVI